MDNNILILTHSRDDTVLMVLEHLKKMNCKTFRFDTDLFHKSIYLSLELSRFGDFTGKIILSTCSINFCDISVVWNRRIHDPQVDNVFQDPELNSWVKDETYWAMVNSFTLFDCPVVNPWEVNERLKYNKLFQMRIATKFGFEVPDSCVTDLEDDIRSFWNKTHQNMIFKKIKKGLFHLLDNKKAILHTNVILPHKFTNEFVNRMRFTPVFLQEHIKKKYDVRSIVIGSHVISFAIHSQDMPEARIDYRTPGILGKLKDIKHEVIDLGPDVNNKILSFVRYFGLTFSAIDFIITPDDRLVFLEDNPNGQWAWLEHFTNAPISELYAETLYNIGRSFHK
ncbi:MAG: hypothetical protein COX77_02130 [Candidatus Komeilibacteria bacterium CG_4_10_14_0_2_um_filter_37_10]|uniref:MvdD-like pre-ATP grasp domain-containing protein n=1 Tax=Candidatus Komeilibacteria bacterium CG_4_10_14_0_2_um_filter_37_10 TaxID=1974470 RepID=A0A2M7VFA1_9BACT|nr:MAG: hypothetical protein COX77_02130 [Candidatus Komeilibacteria bacterium CG_4_10_14_0_2_um_filter_37_10]PJA92513.1 MAG: hypothetical protein CO133_02805 [Candidatus Komeilibacteria bacterium CG_4_9_14_3_um_filter_37_5]